MILLAALLVLSAQPQLPAGVSCDQIRALVAEHGHFKAIVWARGHGYSWREINEAKRCLE